MLERLEGLHVAIETCGFAPADKFVQGIRRCDLVLFDLKLVDPEAHKRWTGADNRVILGNLQRLADLGVPYVIRTPLVPGVTDTETNLRAIARLARDLPGRPRVELLPYNPAAGENTRRAASNGVRTTTRPRPAGQTSRRFMSFSSMRGSYERDPGNAAGGPA